MGKDPAFLLYSSDFLAGIQDLTMEERGQYITLLCLQHQKGHLSEKVISLAVAHATADVLAKFRQDSAGLWYNARLEAEIENRKVFSKKQSERAKDGWKKRKNNATADATAHAVAMPVEDENVNQIVFGIKNRKEWQVSIKKVYATDRVKVIYDLREWFKHTGQLEALEVAGMNRYDHFMQANPAGIFDDDRHLYNAFRKFCKEAPKGFTLNDIFPDLQDDD